VDFMIDLPINVAKKNVKKLILNKPQINPAKSNNGLGIDANNNTIINGHFLNNP